MPRRGSLQPSCFRLLVAGWPCLPIYRMKLIAQGVAACRPFRAASAMCSRRWSIASPGLHSAWRCSLPIGVVQRRRRKRVEQVEQDLPLALELLATLSEAGLSFDSALARIIESGLADRTLAGEFRSFQADLMAGRSRVDALRRLARRMEVSTMTILVSALVQAEQLGTGIAQVIRRQADDLRERRRERANAFAASLAVKRMFPWCFAFCQGCSSGRLGRCSPQLFRMADSMMRTRGL